VSIMVGEEVSVADYCRYCATEPNGDPVDDHQDILRKKVGAIGSTDLYAGVHILSGKLWWYLCGDEIDYPAPSVRISYCPMCGRELHNKKSRAPG